jgi:RNA polymerase sigma-70 factor (sigma-E family)
MGRADDGHYREFVVSRLDRWRRAAYLLCHDWHQADDLVSVAIGKLYRKWTRASAATNMDAYVQGILVHTWLDERRRPWRREFAVDQAPDTTAPGSDPAEGRLPERMWLTELLANLSPRQRAVVVLRFYCDLSVAETAEILAISEGTVKSQAARGLLTLRPLAAQAYRDGE